MKQTEAVCEWVASCFSTLRRSQQKTLGALVGAAVVVHHVTLAALGRAMLGRAKAKHRIKRVDRFLGNERIETADAMAGVAARLLSRRRKPVVVLLDWGDIRQFMVLVAAVSLRGRALPLVWASYEKWEFFRSQNQLEEGLVSMLRTVLPPGVTGIVVADRGFGRVSFARHLQAQGFHYVLRVKGKVWIDLPEHWGRLESLGLREGDSRWEPSVRYGKQHRFETALATRWEAGSKEPWYLITDVPAGLDAVMALYRQRMRIEELFRDQKNVRNGWALRQIQIRRKERLERLLLVLAVAYAILVAYGLLLESRRDARDWSSARRKGRCSLWTIARLLIDRTRASFDRAIAKLVATLRDQEAPNWG
jgi:hypothetical protein